MIQSIGQENFFLTLFFITEIVSVVPSDNDELIKKHIYIFLKIHLSNERFFEN